MTKYVKSYLNQYIKKVMALPIHSRNEVTHVIYIKNNSEKGGFGK